MFLHLFSCTGIKQNKIPFEIVEMNCERVNLQLKSGVIIQGKNALFYRDSLNTVFVKLNVFNKKKRNLPKKYFYNHQLILV